MISPLTTLVLGMTVLAMALTSAGFAQSDAARPAAVTKLEDAPRLTVRGEADLRKPADEIRLRLGVVSEGEDASGTLKENNRQMRAVIKAIEGAGLKKDEYETGRFRIRPRYSRRPRQASQDWQPKILGYAVDNDVLIRTKRIDLAGDLIGAANEAGANSVDFIGFALSDPRQHRAEAIDVATKNAIADARTLADAASLRLVRIINISLDSMPMPAPEMMNQRAMAMADAGGAAPPIAAGDVTVRAGVTVVYEIAGKN